MSRFYHLDLRDRWRVENGRRVLSLRMIAVRLRYLPAESALVSLSRDGRPVWELRDVLLAHIWQATANSKKPHPALVQAAREQRASTPMTPQRQHAVLAFRRRAEERRQRIAAGELTSRGGSHG